MVKSWNQCCTEWSTRATVRAGPGPWRVTRAAFRLTRGQGDIGRDRISTVHKPDSMEFWPAKLVLTPKLDAMLGICGACTRHSTITIRRRTSAIGTAVA